MNCPNCGAPLQEGAAFCTSCGMPVAQQPQQQAQPGPQVNPAGNFNNAQNFGAQRSGNLIQDIKNDPFKGCSYIGYVFTFLASFMPFWVSVSVFGISSHAGLFAADGGILKLYGILFLLGSIAGCLIEFGPGSLSNITTKYKQLPYSQFYIPGLFFILYFLVRFTSYFKDAVNIGYHWGFIKWICLLGVILLLVRPIMCLVKKQDYWA